VQVMRAIGEDVRIDRGDGGTTVTFRVPVPAAPVAPRGGTERTRPRGAPAAVTAVPDALTPTLHVAGDLDLDGAAATRPALLAALAPGPLVVDLSDIGYVSSTGVALLVELATTARERGTRLSVRVAAGSPLARVLDLTGLGTTLPVADAS
jgi:anti-anti-sigma factor